MTRDEPTRGVVRSPFAWAFALLVALSSGCTDDEVRWETAASAVGAQAGDEEALAERFREYRVAATGALDEMDATLAQARRGVSVVDRPELDALVARAATLRQEFVASAGAAGSASRRGQLERGFDDLREDVETFLLRVGHSEDVFARWRALD